VLLQKFRDYDILKIVNIGGTFGSSYGIAQVAEVSVSRPMNCFVLEVDVVNPNLLNRWNSAFLFLDFEDIWAFSLSFGQHMFPPIPGIATRDSEILRQLLKAPEDYRSILFLLQLPEAHRWASITAILAYFQITIITLNSRMNLL
jgi:hypothetical protein